MNQVTEKESDNSASLETAEIKSSECLRYEKPVLICYGDVRDITLGPSPGAGESGAGFFTLNQPFT